MNWFCLKYNINKITLRHTIVCCVAMQAQLLWHMSVYIERKYCFHFHWSTMP